MNYSTFNDVISSFAFGVTSSLKKKKEEEKGKEKQKCHSVNGDHYSSIQYVCVQETSDLSLHTHAHTHTIMHSCTQTHI